MWKIFGNREVKKYSRVESGAYGFERALAFVTIHPEQKVKGNWQVID